MGMPLTEFTIETVLRDGLNELRINPDRFDDLFSKFTQAYFNNQYGQDKIEQIKTYVITNQIKLIQSEAQIPTFMPCISIKLISSVEREDLQTFHNEFEDEETAKTPTVYVPVVTPGTYDALTGKLTITNAADLSTVCPGLNFVDFAGTTFIIKNGNSNMSGDKYINIGRDNEPDLGGDGRIESRVNFIRTERRKIRLAETIRLGCHANDNLHLAKFMYAIVTYILKSRQESLIKRGIHLDSGNASMFDREEEYEGENVFSRYIEVDCHTEFDWDQAEVAVMDCFDAKVRTNAPDPDSEDTVVISPTEESE